MSRIIIFSQFPSQNSSLLSLCRLSTSFPLHTMWLFIHHQVVLQDCEEWLLSGNHYLKKLSGREGSWIVKFASGEKWKGEDLYLIFDLFLLHLNSLFTSLNINSHFIWSFTKKSSLHLPSLLLLKNERRMCEWKQVSTLWKSQSLCEDTCFKFLLFIHSLKRGETSRLSLSLSTFCLLWNQTFQSLPFHYLNSIPVIDPSIRNIYPFLSLFVMLIFIITSCV